MDKIKEKTIALMMTIDDVYFNAFMNSRQHPELKPVVRVLGNVQEYLENFVKFCENGEKIDELLNPVEYGQEDTKCSGEAE